MIVNIHCLYLEYSVGKLLFKQKSSNAGVWKAAYNGSRSSARRVSARRVSANASSRERLLAVGTVLLLTVFIVGYFDFDDY
ncbi:MAG: hypothetical protein ACNYPE_08245 [Candidatus Azotimanducaceae bacterium WSBS_2022_MAG_OTU7]